MAEIFERNRTDEYPIKIAMQVTHLKMKYACYGNVATKYVDM